MNSHINPKKLYLNLYFQVHQPRRIGQFSFFDIGTGRDYFDDGLNQMIMNRVATHCYLPANRLLLKLIRKHPGIRITFSISGSALKQMEVFAPRVLESFQMLAATGAVEFLAETYYHSLSFLTSKEEFKNQIEKHASKVKTLFGVSPRVFRNTELIYNDEIGNIAHDFGFTGVITEGIEKIIHDRSPNHLYQHPHHETKLVLRNYRLSDDIAFRFMDRNWQEWPLTPSKYISWLETIPKEDELITLSMDYETFGEHQKADTGIFTFLETLLIKLAKHKRVTMITPSQAVETIRANEVMPVPESISWADESRDLSSWLGNEIQQDAFETMSRMQEAVRKTGSPALLNTWRYLQTSDHFYYMSTKTGNDGSVHNYFSPYASPYEAFMNYMNVLSDFSIQIEKHNKEKRDLQWLDEGYNVTSMNDPWKPEALTF